MMEKWKLGMDNLLVFVSFSSPYGITTFSLKLGSGYVVLFTAIVTTFALDTMSDFNEGTATKILRILVEQSTTNQTIDLPPPKPTSSILEGKRQLPGQAA